MDCQKVDTLLPAWALEELDPADKVGVRRHLESCLSCQASLVEIQEALGLLETDPDLEPGPELAQKTLAALEQARAAPPSWSERWGRLWHQVGQWRITPLRGALATAFGFVLFFSLLDFTVVPASAPGAVSVCHQQVRQVGKAITKFQADHQNELPENLDVLLGEYMPSIPTCPAARRDTYSESYKKDTETGEFELHCHGHYHASEDTGPNLPRYRRP